MDKERLFKWGLVFLVLACLATFFFLYKYANSEGIKCLADPYGYYMNHSTFGFGK